MRPKHPLKWVGFVFNPNSGSKVGFLKTEEKEAA